MIRRLFQFKTFSFLILALHLLTPARSQVSSTSNKYKGVIEIGASGFNSFIIQLDEDKNWKLHSSKFGQSYLLEEDKLSDESTINEGLKKYIYEMSQVINLNDIHLIVSSGAYNQRETKKIITYLEEIGYKVNVVSSEKEGQLAFKSVVPDSQKNKTMVIDVGSSNTKISWFQNDEIVSMSTYGSKFFKDNIADSIIVKDLKEIASKMPKNRTKTVYLIGGMPYKYAKESRVDKERYTRLAPLETYQPESEKERCGALILKELRDEGKIEEYVFDWDSNFSIGFLLELPY